MTAILAFFTSGIGRWVVLAAVVTVSLAVVRHHLIQEGRDEILNEMARQEVRVRNLRDGITQSMEAKHAAEIAAISNRWSKFIAGLRDRSASAKPVPITANVCQDAAANAGLSDAVSGYLAEAQRIRSSERTEVTGLLEQAERNTKALVDTEQWLSEQGAVK